MSEDMQPKSTDPPPRWDPYLHTAYYLFVALAFFAFCGFLAESPALLLAFFLITSTAALACSLKLKTHRFPLWYYLAAAAYFGLVGFDFLRAEFQMIGGGYAVLCAAWLLAGFHACWVLRKSRASV